MAIDAHLTHGHNLAWPHPFFHMRERVGCIDIESFVLVGGNGNNKLASTVISRELHVNYRIIGGVVASLKCWEKKPV